MGPEARKSLAEAGLLPRVAGQGAKDVTLSQGEVARVLRQNGLRTAFGFKRAGLCSKRELFF